LDDTAAANKATAKALASAVNPIDDVRIPVKVSRKRAEEFWDEDAVENDTAKKPKKGNKKSKTSDDLNGGAEVLAAEEKPQKSKKTKAKAAADVAEPEAEDTDKSKKAKKSKTSAPKSDGAVKAQEKPTRGQKKALATAREEGEEEDDQTAALLAGFESDEDDSDIEKEDEVFDEKRFSDSVPKELLKEVEPVRKNEGEPGVIYLGYALQVPKNSDDQD
jgi:nucleolar protein 15